ncbi:hypothetical protein [Duganella hordei]|uniref:hypothetical protein n=1 Tax=Duganella hordei TaxID=2865934 RepID=UPI0030E9C9F8
MNSASFTLPTDVVVGLGRDYVISLSNPAVATYEEHTSSTDKSLVVLREDSALMLAFGVQQLRISLANVFGGEVRSIEWFGYPSLTLVLWFGHTRTDGGVSIVTAPQSEKAWFVDAQRQLDPLVPGGVAWNVK